MSKSAKKEFKDGKSNFIVSLDFRLGVAKFSNTYYMTKPIQDNRRMKIDPNYNPSSIDLQTKGDWDSIAYEPSSCESSFEWDNTHHSQLKNDAIDNVY